MTGPKVAADSRRQSQPAAAKDAATTGSRLTPRITVLWVNADIRMWNRECIHAQGALRIDLATTGATFGNQATAELQRCASEEVDLDNLVELAHLDLVEFLLMRSPLWALPSWARTDVSSVQKTKYQHRQSLFPAAAETELHQPTKQVELPPIQYPGSLLGPLER